jgi:hypothetical protein
LTDFKRHWFCLCRCHEPTLARENQHGKPRVARKLPRCSLTLGAGESRVA